MTLHLAPPVSTIIMAVWGLCLGLSAGFATKKTYRIMREAEYRTRKRAELRAFIGANRKSTQEAFKDIWKTGHFNAAANENDTRRKTNNCQFLGSRSKPIPPITKVHIGLSALLIVVTAVLLLMNKYPAVIFLFIGIILGPPLVVALTDNIYPLEAIEE